MSQDEITKEDLKLVETLLVRANALGVVNTCSVDMEEHGENVRGIVGKLRRIADELEKGGTILGVSVYATSVGEGGVYARIGGVVGTGLFVTAALTHARMVYDEHAPSQPRDVVRTALRVDAEATTPKDGSVH